MSPLLSTRKLRGKPKGLIRHWNSIYEAIVHIRSTIGHHCFLAWSMPTTLDYLNLRRQALLKLIMESAPRLNGLEWCQIIQGYTSKVSSWSRIWKVHGRKSEQHYRGHKSDNGNGMTRSVNRLRNMSCMKMLLKGGQRKPTGRY